MPCIIGPLNLNKYNTETILLTLESVPIGVLQSSPCVGEEIFITVDAEWVFVSQDVTMARQRHVTVPAGKVPGVPVLVHGFRVFSRKYQLLMRGKYAVQAGKFTYMKH